MPWFDIAVASTDSLQQERTAVISPDLGTMSAHQFRERNRGPSLEAVIGDLESFISKGAGFWRGLGLELDAISAMRIVSDRESPENGPDARNEAIEKALADAISALEKPTRDAALHLFGLSDAGRRERGKTARSDLAAKALYTNGRSFRRKGEKEGRPQSMLEQLTETTAKSLLKLEVDDAPEAGGPRPLLLYVEDTEAFVTVVREALPDYEVVCAETLGKAMDALLRGGPFALVLVDPNLTDLEEGDGLEVLEYLRDHMADTPRVVVTGSRFAGAITKNLGERYGVSEILIKGDYTLPDLRSTVDRAVERGGDKGRQQRMEDS